MHQLKSNEANAGYLCRKATIRDKYANGKCMPICIYGLIAPSK